MNSDVGAQVPKEDDSASEEMQGAPTVLYFNTLPENAVRAILRWISASPRSPRWISYISATDVAPLFGVSGGLGTCVSRLFDTLDLGDRYPNNIWNNVKEHALVEREINTFNSKDLHAFMRFASSNVRSLNVGSGSYLELPLLNMLRSGSFEFPNLERLSMHYTWDFTFDSWAWLIGRNLKSLCLQHFHEDDLTEVAEHCSNLRQLKLNYDGDGTPFSTTEDFWLQVGKRLELLEINDLDPSSGSISHIEKHCRSLTSVEICNTHGREIQYLKLLESLGKQLEYALVHASPIEHIKRMATACSNARFSWQIGSGIRQRFVSRTVILDTLGLQLESATALYPFLQSDPLNERVDWSACSNLKDINLIGPSKVDISAVFETPKPNLRSLSMQCTFNNDGIVRLMRLISLRTGALDDIRMIVKNQIPPEAFVDLVKRNNSLSHVRISPFHPPSMKWDLSAESMRDFVEFLMVSPVITTIDLYSGVGFGSGEKRLECISELCHRNRFRKVCVTVYGRCYMY